MLELKNIWKSYRAGDTVVQALKDIDLCFRENEFVAILGPSGCGKTTLLNLIGGLDRYDKGDLSINGISTGQYKDGDWDVYRNRSIGFVFQSYNLIPHQSVLANVELAMTLSGISKKQRRQRAEEALRKVGLGDQLHKKPGQMSGGQMQRVAIARALVNNPDILLADEPTGALDSATSVQIMDLLREISKDKLIIMVTHNDALANEYASRIVRLLDGQIVGDTNPYVPAQPQEAPVQKKQRKKALSLATALGLSFQNLLTKKGRTLLTAFAGSIGIIGIALILSLPTGVTQYITDVQKDTMSSYPIEITRRQTDLSGMITALQKTHDSAQDASDYPDGAVYSNPVMYELMNSFLNTNQTENNMEAFSEFLRRESDASTATTDLYQHVSDIQYGYDLAYDTYVMDADGKYRLCDLAAKFQSTPAAEEGTAQNASTQMMGQQFSSYSVFGELLSGKEGDASVSDAITSAYDCVYGRWPQSEDEMVLVLNKNNTVTDLALYAMGLVSEAEMNDIMANAYSGKPIEITERSFSYDAITEVSFQILPRVDRYTDANGDGIFDYVKEGDDLLEMLIKNGIKCRIVGIVRPGEGAASAPLTGSLYYTAALGKKLIDHTAASSVYKAQSAAENENFDVLSGLPFTIDTPKELSDAEKKEAFLSYAKSLSDEDKTALYESILATPSEETLEKTLEEYLAPYQTREAMEQLISQYYGSNAASVLSYLSSYSDEEVQKLLRDTVREMVLAQYKNNAATTLEKIRTTPNDAESARLVAAILQNLPTKQAQIGYILNAWTQKTSMSRQAAMTYLSSLSDAALQTQLQATAKSEAAELYRKNYAGGSAAEENAKTAAAFDQMLSAADDATLVSYYDTQMPSGTSSSTLEDNLALFGAADTASPAVIRLYADSFADKDAIADAISAYNESSAEEDKIEYTDYVALIMSSVTTVINAISYVLIAFVAISLVVSSIMIGIITYISVLERTKEIGILRAIGASKADVSRVFNAETMMIGLTAGAIGIGATVLLCLPINLAVRSLTHIDSITAYLPPLAALILVAVSVGLTLIAGLIPAKIAAKKDPVVSLRSE